MFNNIDFEFAFGAPLGGSREAGLGLEILPKFMFCMLLNINPIGCIQPSFVKVFGWDVVP
jgi:hypothetical protein